MSGNHSARMSALCPAVCTLPERTIVLDGLNICRDATFGAESPGSAQALLLAIEHFKKLTDCRVYAILPAWALRRESSRCLAHPEVLDTFLKHPKCIHLAPAGVDEDDFIISLARMLSGLTTTAV